MIIGVRYIFRFIVVICYVYRNFVIELIADKLIDQNIVIEELMLNVMMVGKGEMVYDRIQSVVTKCPLT